MARTRPNPPVIHMIVAMAVVLLPALLAVAWFQRVPEPPIARTDPAPVASRAAEAAPYAVAVPALPDGWVCTRARWTPQGRIGVGGQPAAGNTFALGYLSPEQRYFAVDQRDVQPAAFVADVTRDGARTGESSVAGRVWLRYESADGRTHALVLQEADHVTIVSGDVSYEALESFAATLRFQG
nr:DUF4245 domain-containing protein [Propionibacterium sp.]